MWRLKTCPRCGGDMFITRELDDCWYEHCLQCGCQHELRDIRMFDGQSEQAEELVRGRESQHLNE